MNDKDDNKMTIGELADAAGVTVRTIRYYVNEGLLPPPEQSGRYAMYENWYLDRLELIRRWKDAYLPLKEIRTRIEPLSNEEVRRMLKQSATQPQLAAAAILPQMTESTEPWEGEEKKAAAKPTPPKSALDYIHAVQGTGEAPQEVKEDVSAYIRRARGESRRPVPPSPQPRPTPRPSSRGSEWRRIEVFPGCELNITEEISRRYWRELEDLMDWISQHIMNGRYASK